MKRPLLILGIFVCGFLGLAKVWGLIFLEFSTKQATYAVAFLGAACSMLAALRGLERSAEDHRTTRKAPPRSTADP